jgi:DNA repair protein RecN (Recombination protein N)
MLHRLTIRNYVLIRNLEIELLPGLNIITGETGAGKSILLGAIGLLLGQRADSKSLWNDAEKCVVEGTFMIGDYALEEFFQENDIDYDAECIIRREIAPGGKSRAFINDTPVTLDMLKALGVTLMDIHSQHDTLLLGNDHYQCQVLDAFAGNHDTLHAYKKAFTHFRQLSKELEALQQAQDSLQAEADFLQYVFDELEKANLQFGEQNNLEQELDMLQNAEDIKIKLNECLQLLDGEGQPVIPTLKMVQQTLNKLANYDSEIAQLSHRCASALEELKDIFTELSHKENLVEQNPLRLMQVEERLSLLYSLSKKYHQSHADGLLNYMQEVQQKLENIENSTQSLAELEQQVSIAAQQVNELGLSLRQTRAAATSKLSTAIISILKDLGMPEAQFDIQMEAVAPTPTGLDKVTFLFSANKGITKQDLKQVASGGEFSRLMLAIKYIQAGKTALPSIIFDEIDTGISGEVARKVAGILHNMSARHQLIAITHTPQIAAAADRHFFVYKDNAGAKTESRMKELTETEQIEELAQMLSGASPTPTALQNARELKKMIKQVGREG